MSEPRVIALVIDDRAVSDATLLRLEIREGLRTSLAAFDESWCPDDPAAWRPVDWRIFLVLPSAPDQLLGPEHVAAFAYQPKRHTRESAVALADRIMSELEMRTVSTPAPFLPLEGAHHVLALATGFREPQNATERMLAEHASRPNAQIHLAVVAAQDDEGSLPVESHVIERPTPVDLAVVVPLASTLSCQCESGIEPRSRITAWAASMHHACVRGWPCQYLGLDESGLFPMLLPSALCTDFCASHPVRVDASGRASCTVTVRNYDVGSGCDADRGWFDPLAHDGVRRPMTDTDEHGAFRVCDVPQLDGDALDACRNTLTCDSCPSGWCQTLVPELHRHCDPSELGAGLRFVGGAITGRSARHVVTCDLVP